MTMATRTWEPEATKFTVSICLSIASFDQWVVKLLNKLFPTLDIICVFLRLKKLLTVTTCRFFE